MRIASLCTHMMVFKGAGECSQDACVHMHGLGASGCYCLVYQDPNIELTGFNLLEGVLRALSLESLPCI